jgi:hypothetical protein
MCRFCTHQRMNGLLTAMAVANPAITALLTIIIFLEKDKLQKRSEAIEAAIKHGNTSVVQTIEAQKQNFINIADRLEALSKDSERSAATFIGLSTALTDSSAVSAKALGGVTQGLQAHATAVTELVTDLSTKMSATSATAISELSKKSAEALAMVADQVNRVELAQVASKEASTQAISELTLKNTDLSTNLSGISATAISELSKKSAEALAMVADQVNRVELAQVASKEASTQAISELTLKNTNLSTNLSNTLTTSINGLSNMLAGAIETAVELVTRVEAAQVASQEASTQAITDLARKTAESLKQVADEIKRIEAAQGEAAKTSAESVTKLTQEVGQTSKSIKELQETLKSTVTL